MDWEEETNYCNSSLHSGPKAVAFGGLSAAAAPLYTSQQHHLLHLHSTTNIQRPPHNNGLEWMLLTRLQLHEQLIFYHAILKTSQSWFSFKNNQSAG